VPHRIRYLEELYRHIGRKPGGVHWTGAQIADWFRTAVAAPV
jgi:allantoinase